MTYVLRTIEQLVNTEEPAWPLVQEWVAEARNHVEVLSPSLNAVKELVSIQVTTRSPLGAIVLETGGILVDHGWLRILGSGHPRLPRPLAEWNFQCGMQVSNTPPPSLLIADDALGGFFALNSGQFSSEGHNVWYFAPDTLKWEDTDKGYTDFILFCFNGDLDKYYYPYRWSGWQKEVAEISGNHAYSIYPPLFAEGPEIDKRFRKAVPISELYSLCLGSA